MSNEMAYGASPAVFLDRDGTIIEDTIYLRDPAELRLLPGSAQAIRLLRSAGFKVVVVTNQSGVARGLLNELDLVAIHKNLRLMLGLEGAGLDGLYYCPYHPEAVIEAYRKDSDWRKPAPGMLLAAAEDLRLDLHRSWMVGDWLTDIEAGKRAGCRTIYIGPAERGCPEADAFAANLLEAAQTILLCGSLPNQSDRGQDMDVQTESNKSDPERLQPAEAITRVDRAEAEARLGSDETDVLTQRLESIEKGVERIVNSLEHLQRSEQSRDFNLSHLVGALVQVVAIALMLGAVLAVLKEAADLRTATVALLGAIAAQLLALTLFSASRQR